MIRPFDLRRPSALGEVGALLGEYGDAAALYAGGTELLLLMKEGFLRPRVLVDVKRVPGLDRVTAVAGGIEIGATASHRSVERSEAVRAHARSWPAWRATWPMCASARWARLAATSRSPIRTATSPRSSSSSTPGSFSGASRASASCHSPTSCSAPMKPPGATTRS